MLGSVGMEGEDGFSGNLAVEAAHSWDNWRLYGQAGMARGLSGWNADHNVNDLYAVLSAEYFVNPNLMLSGLFGVSRYTSENTPDTYTDDQLHWGAEVDFKPDNSPVTFYGAYHGVSTNEHYSTDAFNYTSTNHTFLVGVKLPFGADSVQTLQNTVGLKDFNNLFGDTNF